MVKKGATSGHRRSARIFALEERARMLAIQRQTKRFASTSSLPLVAAKKRGRKCKSLQAVVVNSVTNSPHQEGEDSKHDDSAAKSEQMEYLSSLQRMPSKETLEFFLDVLQRRDMQEIFAQPVDPQEVVGYYNIIKEPMDFGTMRAKLQEGLYTSLDQFERDVFLISSNAMKFNSSTTVFYTEARAISELAQRLFHALKTEPENFQLQYTRTRRRSGRKAQGEAGSSHARVAKSSSLNDSSRTTQRFLGRSYLKSHIGHVNNGTSSGSREGRDLNSSETDRRMTYMPRTLCSENEKIVSAVYNAPKSLTQVTNAGTWYADSLTQFAKDLGPTAQMIANKKLGKYPVEVPESLSWAPARLGMGADCLPPKPSAMQNPAYLNGGIDSCTPYNFLSDASASYKGKMVCNDGGLNSFWQESMLTYNNFPGVRPDTTNSGMIDYNLLREEGANSSRNTDALGSSKEKINSNSDNMDLLIATVMQISKIQNRKNHTPSCIYYPLTGYEHLPTMPLSQKINNESYTWLLNHSEPTHLLYASTSKAVATSFYLNGKGMNTDAPAALDQNYMAKAVQPVGWKQLNQEEPIVAASIAPDQNYMAKAVQTVGWKQLNAEESTVAAPIGLDPNYMAKAFQPVGWEQSNGEEPSVTASIALDYNYMPKALQPVGWKQLNGEEPFVATSVALGQNYIANALQSVGWKHPNGQKYMAKSAQAVQTMGWKQPTGEGPSIWKQPTGEGPSISAPAAMNQNYMAWKQPTSWGFPAICNFPVSHAPFNEQIPLMQWQSQVASSRETPLFNAMNFLEGANPQGHRSETSTQCFWNPQQSFLTNKLPDLDLQL